MKIQIINESKHKLPSYATGGSAGMDLYADIENGGSITINPMERELISTGLRIALQKDMKLKSDQEVVSQLNME